MLILFNLAEGPSPTPIGPPRTNSPLHPSTPPMPDIMRLNEDRRQPRPIGGERSVRKAPGPGPLGIPGNLEFNNDPLWNMSPRKYILQSCCEWLDDLGHTFTQNVSLRGKLLNL